MPGTRIKSSCRPEAVAAPNNITPTKNIRRPSRSRSSNVPRTRNNLAASLKDGSRFDEAKSLLRKTIPVAQRILGESDQITRTMRKCVAEALYKDDDATLDDLREAVTTLEDTDRIAQRVLGGAHPFTEGVVRSLRIARAALRARDTAPSGSA